MAKWGIKVSQPNKDVKTCADKDLVFSTNWNTPKIIERGNTTLTVANYTEGEVTINHNYGWVGVLVYIDLAPNKYYFCDASSYGTGQLSYGWCYIYENCFTVYINNWSGAERTYNIQYLILREKAG